MLALQTADERPYAFDKCDQIFQDKSLLNMHKKIHSYEKPCLCHKCEKIFKHKSDLNKREKTHSESGEKPFSWNVCNKYYPLNLCLTVHNRTAAQLKRVVVDCEESIKVEGILEEIEEEENIENSYFRGEESQWQY